MGSGLIVGSRGQRVLATYFLISSPPCEGAGEGTASFPNCISLIITNTYRAGMGAARGTNPVFGDCYQFFGDGGAGARVAVRCGCPRSSQRVRETAFGNRRADAERPMERSSWILLISVPALIVSMHFVRKGSQRRGTGMFGAVCP